MHSTGISVMHSTGIYCITYLIISFSTTWMMTSFYGLFDATSYSSVCNPVYINYISEGVGSASKTYSSVCNPISAIYFY